MADFCDLCGECNDWSDPSWVHVKTYNKYQHTICKRCVAKIIGELKQHGYLKDFQVGEGGHTSANIQYVKHPQRGKIKAEGEYDCQKP